MTLGPALKMTGLVGGVYIVIMFTVFFVLSCIILIIMEGVSAMVSRPGLGRRSAQVDRAEALTWRASFTRSAWPGSSPFPSSPSSGAGRSLHSLLRRCWRSRKTCGSTWDECARALCSLDCVAIHFYRRHLVPSPGNLCISASRSRSTCLPMNKDFLVIGIESRDRIYAERFSAAQKWTAPTLQRDRHECCCLLLVSCSVWLLVG